MTMDWFSIAWITAVLLVILYALRRMIDRRQAKDSLDASLMSERLAQINQPEQVRRNEELRREGKIW
jgi:hypothetical protein